MIAKVRIDGLRFLKGKLGDRFLAGIVIGVSGAGYQYADRLCITLTLPSA